jgi:hypothetical protein
MPFTACTRKIGVVVSGEICGKFVEIRLRNSTGDAQDFFPHWARLPCLEGEALFRPRLRALVRTVDRVLMMGGIIAGIGFVV